MSEEKDKKKEEIDEVMEEMQAETSRKRPNVVHDEIDVKGQFSKVVAKIFQPSRKKSTSKISKPTKERYYDPAFKRFGIAVIFNQITFSGMDKRSGTRKDAEDLSNVLEKIGFEVEVWEDFTTKQIRNKLISLSESDHSDCYCLLVTLMTHGDEDGQVYSRDGEFNVQELWENFLGENCESLVTKPKLFFVQACRGRMVDPGVIFKPQPKLRMMRMSDTVDAQNVEPDYYVLPSMADILVMYSTSEGYYSFRNPSEGSWFIQALCQELSENLECDLMTILTGVNRSVAFAKQSNVPNSSYHEMKQMPCILSMLTKTMYLKISERFLEDQLENA
ncbi:CLUMA_CG020696, isoform A [Clunio marinus]|uniref:CLUMA_CG020696, isoform A n=1 Tax=Clunio marinus TaxID=568069 RepID=A0A1J1J8F3_9DIPT|nr:CLUMA_CG020696, isoform A [Clunio marinus]